MYSGCFAVLACAACWACPLRSFHREIAWQLFEGSNQPWKHPNAEGNSRATGTRMKPSRFFDFPQKKRPPWVAVGNTRIGSPGDIVSQTSDQDPVLRSLGQLIDSGILSNSPQSVKNVELRRPHFESTWPGNRRRIASGGKFAVIRSSRWRKVGVLGRFTNAGESTVVLIGDHFHRSFPESIPQEDGMDRDHIAAFSLFGVGLVLIGRSQQPHAVVFDLSV